MDKLGFKATDAHMRCRDFQYELGKQFKFEGDLQLCNSGFHFCKTLIDVEYYYDFNNSNRFFIVRYDDKCLSEDDKCVTNEITLLEEIKGDSIIELCSSSVYKDLLKENMNGLLLISISQGHFNVVKYLVSTGANIHANDDQAVRSASRNGHLDVVKYLVEAGTLSRTSSDSVADSVADSGADSVADSGAGADIHAKNDEAVRSASRNGHLEVVKYLVEAGADIHACNDDPVRSAGCNGHVDVVKYLVSLGADIHAENDEAVRWARWNGHLDVVKYLVEAGTSSRTSSGSGAGADIHAWNDQAVRWASDQGHLDVVKYLVEVGTSSDSVADSEAGTISGAV